MLVLSTNDIFLAMLERILSDQQQYGDEAPLDDHDAIVVDIVKSADEWTTLGKTTREEVVMRLHTEVRTTEAFDRPHLVPKKCPNPRPAMPPHWSQPVTGGMIMMPVFLHRRRLPYVGGHSAQALSLCFVGSCRLGSHISLFITEHAAPTLQMR